jgi:elongation factor P
MAETISTNQFKNGMHVEVDGIAWRIVEFQHVKPGKGGAFVRTKLKAVDSGKVVERTFRAGETMPRVQTSTEDVQYLYDDGTNYVFMRVENYEQIPLAHESVAAEVAYLKEGDTVSLLSMDGVPSSLQLPASVELTVSQTEPGVKGDTVSNVTKAATLETGAVVQVPLFVNEGDRVKVDTRDGRYLSRA